ncbi:hypothetical protein [Agrobacterium rubi]|uniref:Uncharacterized protein n=1 Tax=Agrobacterium rubi TaxID=28099 RepID=A0AAE7R7N9_9HYPH|nr:hypothetical protein [Agrobacterium rubi]MBP1878676.1 hypothetical protein [Agrobacterium rubi]MCL6652963.1 hypothetical protein [Agrobacterium rubi]NTE88701.1 hypothetical protein [Agrobacterium rubi]NTF04529.1 hypothetical protein [Agrobacterium rubi]NTF10061.1 hypothetical protein [Agrobacterium rubi]
MPSNTSLVNVDEAIICIFNQKAKLVFLPEATKPVAAAELPQVAPTMALWTGTTVPVPERKTGIATSLSPYAKRRIFLLSIAPFVDDYLATLNDRQEKIGF